MSDLAAGYTGIDLSTAWVRVSKDARAGPHTINCTGFAFVLPDTEAIVPLPFHDVDAGGRFDHFVERRRTFDHVRTVIWESSIRHAGGGISHDGLRLFHYTLIHDHVGGHLALDQPPELLDDTDDDETPGLLEPDEPPTAQAHAG